MFKRKEQQLILHKGVFKRPIGLFTASMFLVSGTVGAGVLGLPYAVARVGLLPGLLYILFFGFLIMMLNSMIGELCARTQGDFQLAGLAYHYIGKLSGRLMTFITYAMWVGVLLIYIIGVGTSLAALFHTNAYMMSLLFFCIISIFVFIGIDIIRSVNFSLSMGIVAIILLIAFFSAPHIDAGILTHVNIAELFFPYGIVLFAFSAVSSIPEVHTLLKKRDIQFKHTIYIGGSIVMILYLLFTYIVVSVTGQSTTEIATVGLGEQVGPLMNIFGNIFAVFAMSTGFLMTSLAFRDSLCWDHHLSKIKSLLIVLGVPLTIFLLQLGSFIQVVDIVGGVLVSLQMIIMLLIYWRAKQVGHLKKSAYNLHHVSWFVILLLAVCSVGAMFSVMKMF